MNHDPPPRIQAARPPASWSGCFAVVLLGLWPRGQGMVGAKNFSSLRSKPNGPYRTHPLPPDHIHSIPLRFDPPETGFQIGKKTHIMAHQNHGAVAVVQCLLHVFNRRQIHMVRGFIHNNQQGLFENAPRKHEFAGFSGTGNGRFEHAFGIGAQPADEGHEQGQLALGQNADFFDDLPGSGLIHFLRDKNKILFLNADLAYEISKKRAFSGTIWSDKADAFSGFQKKVRGLKFPFSQRDFKGTQMKEKILGGLCSAFDSNACRRRLFPADGLSGSFKPVQLRIQPFFDLAFYCILAA
jgi:hypothetical protein